MPRRLAPIVFSHANGFPAGTYRRLFQRWRAAGHAVHAIEKIGHGEAFPVTSNWPHLRDELIHFAEREAGARSRASTPRCCATTSRRAPSARGRSTGWPSSARSKR